MTTAIEYNNMITERGEDGFYRLDMDKEAVLAFVEDIREKRKPFASVAERYRWLVDNDYYYDVFEQYTLDQLEELDRLADAYDFKFQSFTAISKFFSDYALKTNDKKEYLEDYGEHVQIVALFLAEGNFEKAKQLVSAMMEQRYQPATPTFMNAGRARRGELVSCFLLGMEDSLNAINFTKNSASQLSKIGGGVAIDVSRLRSRGSSIKGIEGVAKGALPVAKGLEGEFSYADQLGQRPGAGAVYINIFHYDSLEMLGSKKINADEDARLSTLSIGLTVPDYFFELAEKNEVMYMFDPHDVERVIGQTLQDIDIKQHYSTLVADSSVRKQSIEAREYLTLIAKTQIESGYPYLMFKDNANRQHALKAIGDIYMSNLCTEIFQVQKPHNITDYGQDDEIGLDISCNLGSLNIVNVMETGKLRESVQVGMDALTVVSDGTSIENAPGVKKANDLMHSVGLGAMNLHGYLAKNGIMYGSKEAIDFVNVFFAAVNFYSIEQSMKTAKDRGETFYGFKQSEYGTGEYFDKYVSTDYLPKTEKVAQLFADITLPTPEHWRLLKVAVMEHGLYHAYRMAIAPTQSISYIQNATSALSPISELIERRTYGHSETFYPMPFLSAATQWYYDTAWDISMYRMIDTIAAAQQHVDQGISTILYVDSDVETRELARYFIYAHRKGLKSLYYTRNRLLSIAECTSCAV